MPLTEKKAISNARWDAENTVRVNCKLNKHTDADIIAWFDRQTGSKLAAVKAAIRAAIAAEKKDQ